MTSSCLLFLLAPDYFVLELTVGYLVAAALQRSHVHFEVLEWLLFLSIAIFNSVSRRGEGPGLKRRILSAPIVRHLSNKKWLPACSL
eukprot:scaffold33346_cov66-Skeletonema_marinoi.AAC.1